jgi:hypothetical protein
LSVHGLHQWAKVTEWLRHNGFDSVRMYFEGDFLCLEFSSGNRARIEL